MNRKWLLIIFGMAVMVGVAAYNAPSPPTVPEVLWGHWITDDPRYEDCFIEVSENFVEVGAKNGRSTFGVVVAISTAPRNNHVNYVITYDDHQGLESYLSLGYEPSSGGLVRLANQKDILWWRMNNFYP